ncbi:biogenesis of lysosome-related organelles complex 1 subunit 2 [Helicoverpa zea]|uniref:biogenesis of lysosome-related organelles complex 1 subunit 2 n=1 Tax=Helicoverpa zea TaxID=7113 RepID=UPI001F589D1A|nr:biogenesis of lysosome-related organelles complex 1 subunit 2 [Helicoverpa zea]XP_047041066.1 biogenesis of lysosome-related organelles complex 1 subunit 2 [Helicoverpa zea]
MAALKIWTSQAEQGDRTMPCGQDPIKRQCNDEDFGTRAYLLLALLVRLHGKLDLYASPSHSSFEVLDPHDPTLSRLATLLFRRTNDYLQGEIACGGDHYILLEEINRLAITKYTDLRNLAVNLNRTLTEYNDLYSSTIKPLLSQIDDIDIMVGKLEENAYRLDSYTKQLKSRVKEMYESK